MAKKQTTTRLGRASRHYAAARRRGWEPSNCEGFVRTLYVRPGGGRWWTRVGFICDGCGAVGMDVDWQAAIADASERARAARVGAEAKGGRQTSKQRTARSQRRREPLHTAAPKAATQRSSTRTAGRQKRS